MGGRDLSPSKAIFYKADHRASRLNGKHENVFWRRLINLFILQPIRSTDTRLVINLDDNGDLVELFIKTPTSSPFSILNSFQNILVNLSSYCSLTLIPTLIYNNHLILHHHVILLFNSYDHRQIYISRFS